MDWKKGIASLRALASGEDIAPDFPLDKNILGELDGGIKSPKLDQETDDISTFLTHATLQYTPKELKELRIRRAIKHAFSLLNRAVNHLYVPTATGRMSCNLRTPEGRRQVLNYVVDVFMNDLGSEVELVASKAQVAEVLLRAAIQYGEHAAKAEGDAQINTQAVERIRNAFIEEL